LHVQQSMGSNTRKLPDNTMNEQISDDCRPVINQARLLSLRWKHGFINYDHLFAAICTTPCLASVYLAGADITAWELFVNELYPPQPSINHQHDVPLTIHAERVIKNAFQLAALEEKSDINTVHLLLSILSYNNDVSTGLSSLGILYADIAAQYYKKPAPLISPRIPPARTNVYSKWERFLTTRRMQTKQVGALWINACDLFMYGQYDDCLTVCKVALSFSPENTEFLLKLINCYTKKRDFGSALQPMATLATAQPANQSYLFTLSYIEGELGNMAEALFLLEKLLEKAPRNKNFLNRMGYFLLREEKYEAARTYLEKAVLADNSFTHSLNNLGYVTYKLGQTKEGLALINQSIAADKSNALAYRNKAVIAIEQNQPTEALENMRLALKFGFTDLYGDEVLELLKKTEA
jgi:tetratricopeptide (TPR) repeat protein